jgi:phosphatidylserine synthase
MGYLKILLFRAGFAHILLIENELLDATDGAIARILPSGAQATQILNNLRSD